MKARQSGRRKIFIALLCIAGALLFLPFLSLLSYAFVDHEYSALIAAQPKTRADVERVLYLYRTHQIDIQDSMWGKDTPLEKDETCRQYLVLGLEPIDIVYDRYNRVIHMFASYE